MPHQKKFGSGCGHNLLDEKPRSEKDLGFLSLTAQNLNGHSYRKSGHSFSPNGQ